MRAEEEASDVLSDSVVVLDAPVGNSFSSTFLDFVPVVPRVEPVTAFFLSDAWIALERFIHDESTFAGFDIVLGVVLQFNLTKKTKIL